MDEIEKKWDRYYELMHAMQSGVAQSMTWDPAQVEPKHLRVGVNSSLVQTSAILKILVDKGIISEEELVDSLIRACEEEVQRYEESISEKLGARVKLG